MALDLKIKEHVKYKFEAFEQKGKLKDDKLIQLEVNIKRNEQIMKDSLDNMNHNRIMESETVKQVVGQMNDRMD